MRSAEVWPRPGALRGPWSLQSPGAESRRCDPAGELPGASSHRSRAAQGSGEPREHRYRTTEGSRRVFGDPDPIPRRNPKSPAATEIGRSKCSPELILPAKRVIPGSRESLYDGDRRGASNFGGPLQPSSGTRSLRLLFRATEIGRSILVPLNRDHRDRCRTTIRGGPPRPSSAAMSLRISRRSTEIGRSLPAHLNRDHRN